MTSAIILKNRVRKLRIRLGLRQSDLARDVGITRQSIIAIEKGRICPSVVVALKIARVLREPVDYLFYLDHDREEEKAPVSAGSVEKGTEADEPAAIWDFS